MSSGVLPNVPQDVPQHVGAPLATGQDQLADGSVVAGRRVTVEGSFVLDWQVGGSQLREDDARWAVQRNSFVRKLPRRDLSTENAREYSRGRDVVDAHHVGRQRRQQQTQRHEGTDQASDLLPGRGPAARHQLSLLVRKVATDKGVGRLIKLIRELVPPRMMPRVRAAQQLLLTILALAGGSHGGTRHLARTNASDMFKTKADSLRILQDPVAITPYPLYDNGQLVDNERRIKDIGQYDRANSFVDASTFNPDVLNKFLEEYASKIKSTTEKGSFKYPFRVVKPPVEPLVLEIDDETTTAATSVQQPGKEKLEENAASTDEAPSESLNDTLKRNKYYGSTSYDDRNGWVTLDAIPWSKSKISKWQANPSTQRPWPEIKLWDKPSAKPWTEDYSIRPTYENNKPWYDKPKPNWAESTDKPWQKPIMNRPSATHQPDKYESQASSQTHKWPSWNKPQRPNSEIITDDKPANFPSVWPQAKPGYFDRYSQKDQSADGNHWHDYPTRYEQQDRPRPILITERPNFSHYQYANNHPPSHPASGDGQWVLLSTNRGYSKSRQRSIKLDAIEPEALGKRTNVTAVRTANGDDEMVPVMTSRRQVRLTVLPSINGTNTTTSHGGLLEVEKTFKSVEQSRKEYELEKLTTSQANTPNKRPIGNSLVLTRQPSNSAVLAAVGAGMLPATMAMMIPMMLGKRRKRELGLPRRILWKPDYPQVNLRELATKYDK